MFSYFGNLYKDMAFSPDKARHARKAAAGHASEVLAAFLQGREKAYAVRIVMKEIEALFGAGAIQSLQLVEVAMALEDEERRASLMEKAMELVMRQVRGDAAVE